jgi:hypothetical protein
VYTALTGVFLAVAEKVYTCVEGKQGDVYVLVILISPTATKVVSFLVKKESVTLLFFLVVADTSVFLVQEEKESVKAKNKHNM